MEWNSIFVLNSILLGLGLAMDAFAVAMVNGLREPRMRLFKRMATAGCYAGFQFLMPLLGWVCVHTIVTFFSAFQILVPWIALALLSYIGGKMILEGMKSKKEEKEGYCSLARGKLRPKELMMQGLATSIDALSVGFTISAYGLAMAVTAALLIAAVTLIVCLAGIKIGRVVGTRLAGGASILGGVILLAIGLEIFIRGIFAL